MTTTTTTQKPLPELPSHTFNSNSQSSRSSTTSGPTRLTVQGRSHLRSFIKHGLKEVGIRGEDEWVECFELALAELGMSITRGGWLVGILRAKRLARERRCSIRNKEKKSKEPKPEPSTDKGETVNDEKTVERDASASSSQVSLGKEERDQRALDQLRRVSANPLVPTPMPSPKHLFLALSPMGVVIPPHDLDFDVIQPNKACIFSPGIFQIPEHPSGDPTQPMVLCGLDEWDVTQHDSADDPTKLIGGTFAFKGLSSNLDFAALAKTLRFSIYVYLSIILEQHLLQNSHVQLHYPQVSAQAYTFSYSSPSAFPPVQNEPPEPPPKSITSNLLSFLYKKTEGFLYRSNSMQTPHSAHPDPHKLRQILSNDQDYGLERLRRISLQSFAARPSRESSTSEASSSEDHLVFAGTIQQIKAYTTLSTSAGVVFPLPPHLVGLAEKESMDPHRRLLAEERAALSSVLGWEGRESRGKGMTGLTGFVRHQGITALYAEYVPRPEPSSSSNGNGNANANEGSEVKSTGSTDQGSSSGSSLSQKFKLDGSMIPCDKARWVSYRYYSRTRGEVESGVAGDDGLGELVERLCRRKKEDAEEKCRVPGCGTYRSDHMRVWIHGNVKVDFSIVENVDEPASLDTMMWASCSVCEKATEKVKMSEGTHMLSFAKYLELLIYSPSLCTIHPSLCEHTSPPQTDKASQELPTSRFNIVRNFARGHRRVEFRTSCMTDVFEIRTPRLQIHRNKGLGLGLHHQGGGGVGVGSAGPSGSKARFDYEGEKKVLWKEIKRWWQSLSDHMDKIEGTLFADRPDVRKKSLPRLPSTVDSDDELPPPPTLKQPRALLATSLPFSPPNTPTNNTPRTSVLSSRTTASQGSAGSSTPNPPDDPFVLLSNLRHSFHKTEQTLYSLLSNTPSSTLNDVRRSFLSHARGAATRLKAWQQKHASAHTEIGAPEGVEPEWWKSGNHVIPGGRVIVREGDWGSIISFTLSSMEYLTELSQMSTGKTTPLSRADSSRNSSKSSNTTTSTNPSTTSSKPSTPGIGAFSFFFNHPTGPDPDSESAAWQEAEACSAVVTRQDYHKDITGLLSIKDVLRHRRSFENLRSGASTPKPLSNPAAGYINAKVGMPASAWAKPAVEVSREEAGGQVSGLPDTAESVEKILHELETSDSHGSTISTTTAATTASSSYEHVECHVKRGKADSLLSFESDRTLGPDDIGVESQSPSTSRRSRGSSLEAALHTRPHSAERDSTLPPSILAPPPSVLAPPVPPKDADEATSSHAPSTIHSHTHQDSATTVATIASTLTSTLNHAMRYIMKQGEVTRPTSPVPHHHHHLLALDLPPIDDKPHIKHEWTIGKRVKFSCTVYYAKQFDSLRKRCGVEDTLLRSLERSENWIAEGGKSRSNFWKTTDERFIIKTLVNAWNVADLQVLIDMSPSYFRYMESTVTKPSVLAKLLGFYTVEVKNLETGSTHAKADLLIMENLFYDRKIARTFDLKGIQGRKVKSKGGEGEEKVKRTLFDGDWIEGQQKVLTLVKPHSKVILQEAIKADAEFLSKSNIMDYSLLLGIDEENHQIACGLVDTIGSFTFAKTLEYKAKHNLTSGREVTVIPPNEYQTRFVTAMNNYFLACPDKWSRPTHESDDTTLPSVL